MTSTFLNLTILDHEHQPVPCPDAITWADWMESGQRCVGRDRVDRCVIHTAFLGMDMGHGLGRPLWFETMVFAPDADLVAYRYPSWDKAAAGHERVMAALLAMRHDGQVPTARALMARLGDD